MKHKLGMKHKFLDTSCVLVSHVKFPANLSHKLNISKMLNEQLNSHFRKLNPIPCQINIDYPHLLLLPQRHSPSTNVSSTTHRPEKKIARPHQSYGPQRQQGEGTAYIRAMEGLYLYALTTAITCEKHCPIIPLSSKYVGSCAMPYRHDVAFPVTWQKPINFPKEHTDKIHIANSGT